MTQTTRDRAAALTKKRAKLQAKKEKAEAKQQVKKNLAQSSTITKMRFLTIVLSAAQVLALDIESDIRGEFYKQGLLKKSARTWKCRNNIRTERLLPRTSAGDAPCGRVR